MTTPNGHLPTDPTEEKQRLLGLLERSRQAALVALQGVSDRALVYADTGWRVQDLLGHLAAWEREALAALQAHAEGEAYSLDDEARRTFNETAFLRRKEFDPMQCRMDWGMVRRDLQFAIYEIDAARLAEPLRLPWGTYGTVADLVERMVRHEEAHLRDIVMAVSQR